MKLFTPSGIILCLCFSMAFFSCDPPTHSSLDPLEQNLVRAGSNRPQLEKVLKHYQPHGADSLKYRAAVMLICNMESNGEFTGSWLQRYDTIFQYAAHVSNDTELLKLKDSIGRIIGDRNDTTSKFLLDLREISAEYLIQNIDDAYSTWQTSPWMNQVSFRTFCNFILPYKVNSEPKEFNWRRDLKMSIQGYKNYSSIPEDMEEVTCAIVDSQKRWFKYTELFDDYPSILGIKSILQGHHGACTEMAVLAAYTNRALGIPTAIDYMPQWGNHTNGHTWDALIISEKKSIPFLGAESRPDDYADIHQSEGKVAKIYRQQLEYNESSFAAIARTKGVVKIPPYLKNPRITDVTAFYGPVRNIELQIDYTDQSPIYLGVFQNGRWNAIAGTWIVDGKAIFKDMGLEVLYMPLRFALNEYKPVAAPLIMTIDGIINEIKPGYAHEISMTLNRKYPLKRLRALNIAIDLKGDRLEASNSADFHDAQLLYTIAISYKNYDSKAIRGYTIRDELDYRNLWESINISNKMAFRYIRLLGTRGASFKIGELAVYANHDTMPFHGSPIGNVTDPSRAFDGWNGYNIEDENNDTNNRWVGMDLGKPYVINQIKYLPANDRNTILPGKTYELFYWDNKWISEGIQKASIHQLTYDRVQDGTIYWVHCLDCNSTEERPFTYKNGNQVWW